MNNSFLWQNEFVDKFKNKNSGALFCDMGTGKTVAMLKLLKKKHIKKVFLITLKDLKYNFEEQKKGIYEECEFEFISTHKLSRDVFVNELLEKLKKEDELFIIVDESSFFKNLEAKRTKNLLKIGKIAKYKFILNGTPICLSLSVFKALGIISSKSSITSCILPLT